MSGTETTPATEHCQALVHQLPTASVLHYAAEGLPLVFPQHLCGSKEDTQRRDTNTHTHTQAVFVSLSYNKLLGDRAVCGGGWVVVTLLGR